MHQVPVNGVYLVQWFELLLVQLLALICVLCVSVFVVADFAWCTKRLLLDGGMIIVYNKKYRHESHSTAVLLDCLHRL
jgi:hypothetical protein